MELHHLRCFIAVAEHLSFTRAGLALRVSQPALTRNIHNLESELEIQLLDRSRSGVSVTEQGKAFLSACKLAMNTIEQGAQAARRIGGAGILHIGYCAGLECDPLPETIVTFQQKAPGLEMRLHDLPVARQIDDLQTQQLDLAFVGCSSLIQHPDLQWESIAEHTIAVVLPANHTLARQRRIQLADLKDAYFVALSEKTHPGFRAWLRNICHTAKFEPKILLDAESARDLHSSIACGFGLTLLGSGIRRPAPPGLALRPLTPPLQTDYLVGWNRHNRSGALRSCVDVLRMPGKEQASSCRQAKITTSYHPNNNSVLAKKR